MKKNDLIEVTIEDYSKNGEGIGHADGYTLFVKDAVIGDRVRAVITRPKARYAYAKMTEILSPSPDRREAPCPEARRCGGCRLQEYDYAAQLRWKRKHVEETLKKIGGMECPEVRPVLGMENPWRYRNKMQFPVVCQKEADGQLHLTAGFYAGRTHRVISVGDCLLAERIHSEILAETLAFMEAFGISAYDEERGSGLIRHLLIRQGAASGALLVCPVVNGRSLPHAEEYVRRVRAFPGVAGICLNVNERRDNVILGPETICLWGEDSIEDVLCGLTFRISPRSFYQVNHSMTERLYGEVRRAAALTGREIVYDLYCGTGTIGLTLAREAKEVYGVEIVPEAVRNARENAQRNGIKNARFFQGAAEEAVASGFFDGETPCVKPDVVVLDPPRKGCDARLIGAVRALAPERIVYVSCDPATLARDAALLREQGNGAAYELVYAQPADMFPQTMHVECVCLLDKII